MWVSTYSGISVTPATPTTQSFYTASNNRFTAVSYDGVGNQLSALYPTTSTFAYDAENRQKSAYNTINGTSTYGYDGAGHRVTKVLGGTTTTFVYDALGRLAAEYSTAQGVPDCTTCYLVHDHLGDTRLVLDESANVMARHDYLPFGGELAAINGRSAVWGATDNINQKFTGKERDSESGLDYFGARYYGSAFGRWASPDAISLTDERISNPTNTINKYVYGGNNTLKYVDRDGRDITLFYTDEGPMGHEMLYAYDTNNGNSAVHSFGPESHGAVARLEELLDIPMSGKNGYGLGNIKSPDDLRQHYASFTIQLNPEDTQKAIQFIKDLKAVNYLTYARNCTSTCADILRKLKLHQWGEIVPQAVFYNFAREHGNENVPYPAQHGTDYGQPRAGHDPFQLLFLTIQHCHAETASWAENGKATGTTPITVCN